MLVARDDGHPPRANYVSAPSFDFSVKQYLQAKYCTGMKRLAISLNVVSTICDEKNNTLSEYIHAETFFDHDIVLYLALT